MHLLLCAQPRCNYLLRVLPPGDTGGFAEAHDRAVARCLERLLGGQGEPLVLPELALRRAQLAGWASAPQPRPVSRLTGHLGPTLCW